GPLAWQGPLDEARPLTHEGLALAHEQGQSFSLAWAYHATAVARQWFGDWAASASASATAVRLAEEHGFPHVLGMATINHGWALIMQGEHAAGIPEVREGVAMVDATGAGLVRPSYLGMLATASLLEGDRQSAAARLDEA